MKKQFLMFAALLIVSLAALAQGQKRFNLYAVGFYNQENLFDTCHDEGKNDYEYLPAKGWNGMKYTNKLHNMARALADMGTDKLPKVGCAFIGMAEVENHKVLDDLIAQEPLKARGMKYCHIEGPDRRGIDCALLYNPALFTVKNVKLVPYVQEKAKDSTYYTRGFLTVRGELGGEDVAVIVCHWPSRFSGPFYRESGARQTKAVKDSLLRINKNMKIFVMGDMNDDPTNKSMHECLQAKPEISQGDFKIENISLGEGATSVWSWASANYGMKASAYIDKVNIPCVSRLTSPAIDLSSLTEATLSFDQAINFSTDMKNECKVQVSTDGTTWEDLEVSGYPESNGWTFVPSTANLNKYCGKKIYISFLYTSSSSAAPTWEIKNVLVM